MPLVCWTAQEMGHGIYKGRSRTFCPLQIGKGNSMKTSNSDQAGAEPDQPVDPDLAEQANPGHGVPSQDPDGAAQVGLTPDEAEREAKSAYVGGGAMAGLAAGAAAGAALGGPIGVLVGGTVGTIAGALGGEAAGIFREPESPESDEIARPDAHDPEADIPPR